MITTGFVFLAVLASCSGASFGHHETSQNMIKTDPANIKFILGQTQLFPHVSQQAAPVVHEAPEPPPVERGSVPVSMSVLEVRSANGLQQATTALALPPQVGPITVNLMPSVSRGGEQNEFTPTDNTIHIHAETDLPPTEVMEEDEEEEELLFDDEDNDLHFESPMKNTADAVAIGDLDDMQDFQADVGNRGGVHTSNVVIGGIQDFSGNKNGKSKKLFILDLIRRIVAHADRNNAGGTHSSSISIGGIIFLR